MTPTISGDPLDRSVAVQTPARVARRPARTTIWLDGDQDVVTAPRLRLLLATEIAGGDADVVMDLAAVTFIDATTLGALVGAHNTLAARGRTLTVPASSGCVRRLFALCELGALLGGDGAPDTVAASALDP